MFSEWTCKIVSNTYHKSVIEKDLFVQLRAVQIGSVSVTAPTWRTDTGSNLASVRNSSKKTVQIIFNFSENAHISQISNLIVNSAPAANISIQFQRNLHILHAVMLSLQYYVSIINFAKLFLQTYCKNACNFVVICSILIKTAYSVSRGRALLFEVFCFYFAIRKSIKRFSILEAYSH